MLLKQLALSATRRNGDALCLARFYGSPAVCESLATSKPNKRLSRNERRAAVVSFVSEYREANDGKFPTLQAILKQVGGGQYNVRNILQELKHKPNATFPIVAKALSEAAASVPNDTSSSQSLNHPLPDESNLEGSNIVITATPDERESVGCSKNSEDNLTSLGSQESKEDSLEGAVISANVLPSETRQVSEEGDGEVKTNENSIASQADNPESPDTVETGIGQNQATIDISHPVSDESNLEGNDIVITATHEKSETEKDPHNVAQSKCDGNTHLPEIPTSVVSEEKMTCLSSQESKPDHPEEAAVSENGLPSETRQDLKKGAAEVKTVEKPSAWSSIVSFAKEFASFWRKG